MTIEERIRSGGQFGSLTGMAARSEDAELTAVVVPQSCSYQHFDAQRRFLVTSLELWQDRVIVQVACPTASEAAALPKLQLQDNVGTGYVCSAAEVRGSRVMLSFSPAAPETIRTLTVLPLHPVSGLLSPGFVTAVRLTSDVSRGGRVRRLPRPAI
jgi:hypothetical protein